MDILLGITGYLLVSEVAGVYAALAFAVFYVWLISDPED